MHIIDRTSNPQCAFIEGWADFFEASVPYENPSTVTYEKCPIDQPQCISERSIESNDWLAYYVYGDGRMIEGAVATALFDLYDQFPSPYVPQDDPLHESFSDIYQVTQEVGTSFDISVFAQKYLSHLRAEGDLDWRIRVYGMCDILRDNLVDVSALPFCVGALCGDANGDGYVNAGDIVFLVCYIFGTCGSPRPPDPLQAGDANCDGQVDIGDVVYLVAYVYRSGPQPCCP
jgi:Dockerin type I domain